MNKYDHLGLYLEELNAIAQDAYIAASDEVADNWKSRENDTEFNNIMDFHATKGVLPAVAVFWDKLEHRSVLTAVAKMIDANNTHLFHQLSALGLLTNTKTEDKTSEAESDTVE